MPGRKAPASKGRNTLSEKKQNRLPPPDTEEELPKLPEPDRKKSKTQEKEKKDSSGIVHQFIPYVLYVLAVFLIACFIFSGLDGAMGSVGKVLRNFFCGLFGWPAFILPVILINLGIYWKTYIEREMVGWKIALGFFVIITVSSIVHSFFITASLAGEASKEYALSDWARTVFGQNGEISNWAHGLELHGGGFFGGLLGGFVRALCGSIGSPIILIAICGLSAMFYFSVTPAYVFGKLKEYAEVSAKKAEERREKARIDAQKRAEQREREERAREEREARKREREEKARAEKERIAAERAAREEQKRKEREEQERLEMERIAAENAARDAESPLLTDSFSYEGGKEVKSDAQTKTDAEAAADEERRLTAAQIMEEVFGRKHQADSGSAAQAVPTADDEPELTLGTIENETEPEDDSVGNDPVSDASEITREQLQVYMFPPIDLLDEVEAVSNEDVSAELQENARKIMAKLRAFNVNIKKIDCSRGPTITRYELYPEATTKVRSISSLSDDISLELASTIRIESPIPGKNAVGIEVPNRVRSKVSLREMIDSDGFRNAKGTVPACLGKDVGGNLQFMDISKLPHIIIAGTTGSGKSVCINTILLSLLYRFRPNELKFIMIDPKKVELGMYNGLPHMKVPVVTNVKRAAGTLNAAANEMDARYALFEENNVRNIDSYNQLMSLNDPNFVPLPRIIIIIDELADLMMTAPAEIEDSIIRLGQMARAAGIHLIVGTQRPAADVVTKRISSNLPSRIAFSVVSYVESKIIINMTGAEKLIGKGDMLYVPTGATKPMRIQGAFVDDIEIKRVTDFIKENSPKVVYDEKFIQSIDAETDRIEAEDKKSSPRDADDGDVTEFVQDADPMFNRALHIAVENKTIATSLLQRKLSLGFGRAAKIIDRMEALGFISGANGTKPRNVLIDEERLRELESQGDVRTQGRFT